MGRRGKYETIELRSVPEGMVERALHPHTCKICGKTFYPTPMWAYKYYHHNYYLYFDRYNCMRAYERQREAAKKKDRVSAERRREIIVEMYRSGLTKTEIAKRMKMTMITVSAHLDEYVNAGGTL